MGEGLEFRPFRPDVAHFLDNPESMRRAFHPRTGTEYLFRRVLLPVVEQSYQDILAAAKDVDLIVGHGASFATPVVAEVLQKRWISVALQPSIFLSALDPPVISGLPFGDSLAKLGPRFWRPFLGFAHTVARGWAAPLRELRKKLGLREAGLFEQMFSAYGTQAWFSKAFGAPQADWPVNVEITGFPFYDQLERGQEMSAELRAFLDAGPAPVVFTLGSSAVMDAGSFYRESVVAVERMGIRAVLLIGRDLRNRPTAPLPSNILAAEYAPYSELLPRAAAVVHQGGVGTTAQALRAGRPMIVVPWSHDQPDNAMRVVRLGCGRTIGRSRYRADRVAKELRALRGNLDYAGRTEEIAARMATEDGVAAACDGLEKALPDRFHG